MFRKLRPRLSTKKLSLSQLSPRRSKRTRNVIVRIHNKFRSSVVPPAEDMLKMSWDEEAAELAQTWSDSCQLLQHNNSTGRWTKRFGECGENIFVSTQPVPWFFAVETWWLKKKFFNYGNRKTNLTQVGHFTQLVWNSSHKVGCGLTYCNANQGTKNSPPPYYIYVCNYCPIGNFAHRLHKPYAAGTHCAACPGQCTSRLCTNSCPVADYWSNCGDLLHDMGDGHHHSRDVRHQRGHYQSRLCTDSYRSKYCKATCQCGLDKIYNM